MSTAFWIMYIIDHIVIYFLFWKMIDHELKIDKLEELEHKQLSSKQNINIKPNRPTDYN